MKPSRVSSPMVGAPSSAKTARQVTPASSTPISTKYFSAPLAPILSGSAATLSMRNGSSAYLQ